MGFQTPARRAEHEDVVKGSRFIALAQHLPHLDALEALLDERRRALDGASHHVWGMRWGETLRSSDDGEPGGTAGRPVLEVVLKRDLDRVVVVVTRYFGGTKLGAGGLARAYGAAAARALDAAGVRLVEDRERWRARLPYAAVDVVVRHATDDRAIMRVATDYDAAGPIVTLEVRSADAERWLALLADLTRGQAALIERATLDA